jgi:hypothetical protein
VSAKRSKSVRSAHVAKRLRKVFDIEALSFDENGGRALAIVPVAYYDFATGG